MCFLEVLRALSPGSLCMISAGDSFVPSGLRASGCWVCASCRLVRLLLPNWLIETRQSSPCGGYRSVRRFDSSVGPVNDSGGRLRNPRSTTPRASSPPWSRRRETFAPIFVYLQTAVPAVLRYSRLGVVERCWLRVPEDSGCRFRVRLQSSRYKRVLFINSNIYLYLKHFYITRYTDNKNIEAICIVNRLLYTWMINRFPFIPFLVSFRCCLLGGWKGAYREERVSDDVTHYLYEYTLYYP